mgnify:CR=1 FL=1
MKCDLLWKLCRRHGWGSPIPKEDLVGLALEDVDQGRGKAVVKELLREPYIGYQRGNGYSIGNDPDSQAQAAFRLRSSCAISSLRIEATLSRFEQAGGFDAYEEDDVLSSLETWG